MAASSITHRTAPVVLGVFLIALWGVMCRIGALPPVLLPAPSAVFTSLVNQLSDPRFWHYASQTVLEAFGGAVIGIAVGITLAALIHRCSWLDAAVTPYLGATQAIPAIAIAPLLVLWVGYGTIAVVVLCAVMVFFPIVIAAAVGLRNVSQQLRDAAALDGASASRILTQIEFPVALPVLLGGVRNGVALSLTGAVVGELIMGGSGLGSLLIMQRDMVNTSGMFATITVLAVFAASVFSAIHLIERKLS